MRIKDNELFEALRGDPKSTAGLARQFGIDPNDSPVEDDYVRLCGTLAKLRDGGKLGVAVDRKNSTDGYVTGEDTYRYFLVEEVGDLEAKGTLSRPYLVTPFFKLAPYAVGLGSDGENLSADARIIFKMLAKE